MVQPNRLLQFSPVALIPVLIVGTAFHRPAKAQHHFDADADGDVDLVDVSPFVECLSGHGAVPDSGCWVHDADIDVDVDLADVGALQRAFGAPPTAFERVFGKWSGTGTHVDGTTYPFTLYIAQWGYRIWAVGWLSVDPHDPLFQQPAVRLAGSIHDGTLVLGMSPRLDNPCLGQPDETDAAVVTLALDPDTGDLALTDLVEYLPIGCERVLDGFTVTYADLPFVAGNTDLLGTWFGDVATPPGWVFAPIPAFHHRKTFLRTEGPAIEGYLEFFVGGTWGEMILEWDPAEQRALYTWLCLPGYRYEGVIDGNKFTGVLRYTLAPNDEFLGVFAHTLSDRFVAPTPLAPCP